MPSPIPGGDPTPRSASRVSSKLVLRVVAGVLAACILLGGFAVWHPERLPAPIGDWVEDLTGVNAHPVVLRLPQNRPLSAVAQLGRDIFFDASLSASGKQSCATCHSPDHAYGPPNDLAVQLGGEHMNLEGYRPPQSLAYLYRQASFSIGPDQGDMDTPAPTLAALAASASTVQRAQKTAGVAPAAPAMVPQGGFFWDGRAMRLQEQAIAPLTNPVEMANPNTHAVFMKLQKASYINRIKQLFGPTVMQNEELVLDEAMFAVTRFELEEPSFHPFTSKYDAWLQGKARLTRAELHGLRLFNDPDKANCAGCHLSKPSPDGLPPLFTDTQYEALGVPRNPHLAVNKDPKFYDMGVCGPFRTDMTEQTQYCGMFLTPTLRNTATRHAFFHNGVYHDLQQVMDFYNFRNTNPDKIYPKDASGKVMKYDDLPAKYHANVDVADAPFDRKAGDAPAMTDDEVKDIIAFVQTLNDGYKP
ncbi:cytochrome-c peroxidase [Pararobbsia silviterrae]|nr:cytochrome c peroxidase [Pararobbsia silviterrae]